MSMLRFILNAIKSVFQYLLRFTRCMWRARSNCKIEYSDQIGFSTLHMPNAMEFCNWSCTHSCIPKFYHTPNSVEEIVKIVQHALANSQEVKVLGSGHSPNNMAFTDDHLVSLCKMNRIVDLDSEKATVLCQAGCKLSQLNEYLERHGFGLKVLGSISNQTIAGIMATGTHSTGYRRKIIAEDIIRVKFVDGLGAVRETSHDKDPELLNAFKCNLGVLGIVFEVEIAVETLKALKAIQYPLAINQIRDKFDYLIKEASEHTRLWWFPHTDYLLVWQASKTHLDYSSHSNSKISYIRNIFNVIKKKIVNHIIEFLFLICCLIPSLVPSFNRIYFDMFFRKFIKVKDVSHKVFNFDCLFRQYVNEWSIPLERFNDAFEDLQKMIRDHCINAHFPVEIRCVQADDIMVSPCNGRDSVFVGIIAYKPYNRTFTYQKYFDKFSRLMESYGGRPHWAKLHHWTYTECAKSYGDWEKFCELRKTLDPAGLFLNKCTKQVFIKGKE